MIFHKISSTIVLRVFFAIVCVCVKDVDREYGLPLLAVLVPCQ